MSKPSTESLRDLIPPRAIRYLRALIKSNFTKKERHVLELRKDFEVEEWIRSLCKHALENVENNIKEQNGHPKN